MNRLELFTMIFYVLDYYWDENQGEELGLFLSSMSPFTFEGTGSADPAVYDEFCEFIKVDKVEIEDSFEMACKYIKWINQPYVTIAFEWVTKEEWDKKSMQYIESLKKQ